MRRTRGFTIVELLIAVTICLAALMIVWSVTAESTDTARVGTSVGTLDGQASRALDRIANEVVAAGLETLEPPDPLGTSSLIFRKSAGVEDARIKWGPRQSIALRPKGDGRELVWVRDLDDPDGVREIVVCGSVRPCADGELPNGADDNGNGLVDEEGLSFDLSGRTLTIRLTLERRDRVGGTLVRTVSTSVRLRN